MWMPSTDVMRKDRRKSGSLDLGHKRSWGSCDLEEVDRERGVKDGPLGAGKWETEPAMLRLHSLQGGRERLGMVGQICLRHISC